MSNDTEFICKSCGHKFNSKDVAAPWDCPECLSMFVTEAPRPQDSLGSGEFTGYKADLARAKAKLYHLLLQFPMGELTEKSTELDIMCALSRDEDMQEIIQRAL